MPGVARGTIRGAAGSNGVVELSRSSSTILVASATTACHARYSLVVGMQQLYAMVAAVAYDDA